MNNEDDDIVRDGIVAILGWSIDTQLRLRDG